MIDPSIFRDYDIRGIYPQQLNEKTFFILGRSIASYLKAKRIAVGRDIRLSSKKLFDSLVKGITEQGVDVIDLGLISTEINYFASGKFLYPANIIVSASHNPPQYNGLKIVKKGVVPLHGGFGLPQIKALAVKNVFPQFKIKGNIEKKIIIDSWISHCLSFINIGRLKPLKVVIDTGNGMGSLSWDKLKVKLPVKIIPLYFEPDGRFPNHLPDPLDAKNLKELQKQVIIHQADFGFAIDGDADRLFIVDDKGQLLSGSITSAILAEHLLKKYGQAPVLYSVTCSRIVPETIKKYAGFPLITRVGHSFIKNEMRKRRALFAAEHSGHFYFRDNYNADSSSIAALLFLEFISQKSLALSAIRKNYDKYFTSGEINYYVDDNEKIFDNLKRNYSQGKIDTIDGITVNFSNWWFNVRPSNTEPLIRLNIEAEQKSVLDKKKEQLQAMIKSLGGRLKTH